jgi:GTP-binding protein EngB required for normal cell division
LTVLAPRHSAPDVTGRITALEAALAAGGTELDPAAVTRARAVLGRVSERTRFGADTTVVALVGATGSGKSSMFNAVSGLDISEVGVTRPTTGKPMACIWGREGAEALLDWLDVPRRHRMERESVLDGDREVPLHGLVLLDVPDHDSTAVEHRLEVDRLVEIVDLMIWVVDPQKYADEALHARYLQHLAGHEEVMLVVLNQVDRLSPDEVEICHRDLRRLLDADGLTGVRVLTASAVRGDGVQEIRSILGEVVHRRTTAAQRLSSDLDTALTELAGGVAEPGSAGAVLPEPAELARALADAAGVPGVLEASQARYRRRGRAVTGWPPARWVGRLRRDPVKRLGLADGEELQRRAAQFVPASTPAQAAAVDAAVDSVVSAAGRGLPPRWASAVRAAASDGSHDGPDGVRARVDAVVASLELGRRSARWWWLVWAVQLLALLALVGGLVWAALGEWDDALGLREVPAPNAVTWDDRVLPWSLVVAAGGLLAGLLVTLLARWWVRAGARRRRARAAAAVQAGLNAVAQESVLRPIQAVLARHQATRRALVSGR